MKRVPFTRGDLFCWKGIVKVEQRVGHLGFFAINISKLGICFESVAVCLIYQEKKERSDITVLNTSVQTETTH